MLSFFVTGTVTAGSKPRGHNVGERWVSGKHHTVTVLQQRVVGGAQMTELQQGWAGLWYLLVVFCATENYSTMLSASSTAGRRVDFR
jgi:hypothetical protein